MLGTHGGQSSTVNLHSLMSCGVFMASQSRALVSVALVFAVLATWPEGRSLASNQASATHKRPGVNDPSVRIPMDRLKPDQVFAVPGAPDWLAIDEDVWVSNEPENSVMRIDPRR